MEPIIVGSRDLSERDMQDSDQERHPTACDKGNEPIVPYDVDTPTDDVLSLGGSPNLSPTKSSKARSCQRHIALHSTTPIMTHFAG